MVDTTRSADTELMATWRHPWHHVAPREGFATSSTSVLPGVGRRGLRF